MSYFNAYGGFTGGVRVGAGDVNGASSGERHKEWIIIESFSSPIYP